MGKKKRSLARKYAKPKKEKKSKKRGGKNNMYSSPHPMIRKGVKKRKRGGGTDAVRDKSKEEEKKNAPKTPVNPKRIKQTQTEKQTCPPGPHAHYPPPPPKHPRDVEYTHPKKTPHSAHRSA